MTSSSITDALRAFVLKQGMSADALRVLAISGAQGCGKTTATRQVAQSLGDQMAVLALDDFYLPKARRERLAKEVSPLFATRGPPGTHDIALLLETLESLKNADQTSLTSVPVFNKVADDRLPEAEWRTIHGRPSVVILEGWCLGAVAHESSATSAPLNEIERRDVDGAWRNYQVERLSTDYLQLWNRIDAFMHLQAPDWETIVRWRKQQELSNLGLDSDCLPFYREIWVDQFVQHYERITRSMMSGFRITGAAVMLNGDRSVVGP